MSREQFKRWLAQRKTNQARLHVGAVIDELKPGWYLRACVKENADGSTVTGTVQADAVAELVAEDSFEAD